MSASVEAVTKALEQLGAPPPEIHKLLLWLPGIGWFVFHGVLLAHTIRGVPDLTEVGVITFGSLGFAFIALSIWARVAIYREEEKRHISLSQGYSEFLRQLLNMDQVSRNAALDRLEKFMEKVPIPR